jgi:nitrate reductase gamma subunit
MLKLWLWLAASNPYNITAKDIGLPTSTTNVTDIFANITQVVMGVLGGIAVIVIIYAAIILSVSRGDAKRVQQAREAIQYAVIGLVVAIAGLAIVTFIVNYIAK